MIRIFANDVDITQYVEQKSIKTNEQLNDRANILTFKTNIGSVAANATIEFFDGMVLVEPAASGQAEVVVEDTYKYFDIFLPGQKIIIDPKGANQQITTIQSIDHDTRIVTFSDNLENNLAKGGFVGYISFAGSVQRKPDEEIGHTGEFAYKVTVGDRTVTFNRKNIVETYQNQYMRQMIGLAIYKECANDEEILLDFFESAWTEGGVALAMSNESVDRIQGTNAQKTGTLGSGVAKRTKSISAVDISDLDDVRLWHKATEGNGDKITTLKYRVGNDASNYYEWSSIWVGINNEDCWNYENFKILEPDVVVGSPNLAAITRLQIEVEANAAIPSDALLFDHSQATKGGFTLKNTIRGDRKFVDVRMQYKKASPMVDQITKLQGFFRYIDYDRDLHVFRQNGNLAPFSLTDTSENYGDLSIDVDVTTIKNRQTVRGGEAPALFRYKQDEITDGLLESWPLDYKPKDLEIYIAYQDFAITAASWAGGAATITTGSAHGYSIGDQIAITEVLADLGGDTSQAYNGSYIITDVPSATTFEVAIAIDPGTYTSGGFVGEFTQKTVGVENLVDPTTVDYVFNFNEKVVRRGADEIIPNGAVIRRDYFPYQAIRVRVQDITSIAAMKALAGGDGIFDGEVINDINILTYEEARKRAEAEVQQYKNPILRASFVTNKTGLHAGQIIHIEDTSRSIDADFLIQRVQRRQVYGSKSEYRVTCGSTMFGLIEFFQLLLKKSAKFEIDVSELVDIVVNQDETISIGDVADTVKKSNVFEAASKKIIWEDFTSNAGSRVKTGATALTLAPIIHTNTRNANKWFASFSTAAEGEIGFDGSTQYNDGNSLYIDLTDNAVSGFAKATSARYAVHASTDYDITWRLQNLVADGITGGLGAALVIREYASLTSTTILATHTLFSNYTDVHDFKNFADAITTNAAANYIEIELQLHESTGKVSLGEMRLIPDIAETATNPGAAEFAEAS